MTTSEVKKIQLISEGEFLQGLNKPEKFYKLTSKVVMHATETCYGLAADIFDSEALNRLYKIKKMPASKPVSMMVRDLGEAERYAEFDDLARRLAEKFWPGPLTLVLPRKRGEERERGEAGGGAEAGGGGLGKQAGVGAAGGGVPDFFNPGHETVGIRCPDSEIARALIQLNGRPLTTTSANISGRPEVYEVIDYLNQLEEFDEVPDLVIDSGKIAERKPSTIVKIAGGKWEILRKGDMAEAVVKYIVQAVN